VNSLEAEKSKTKSDDPDFSYPLPDSPPGPSNFPPGFLPGAPQGNYSPSNFPPGNPPHDFALGDSVTTGYR
jgi:hypothetical protein